MPIAYQRDDQRWLITVTVTEPCPVNDISSVIDRQAAEDAWEYTLLSICGPSRMRQPKPTSSY